MSVQDGADGDAGSSDGDDEPVRAGVTTEEEPATELGEVLNEVEETLGEDARHTLEIAIIRKALDEDDAVTRDDLAGEAGTGAGAVGEGV